MPHKLIQDVVKMFQRLGDMRIVHHDQRNTVDMRQELGNLSSEFVRLQHPSIKVLLTMFQQHRQAYNEWIRRV